MTDIHSPRIPQIPLLLLLESTQSSKSQRAMQIGASGFEIIRANDASGIYLMRGKLQLAFAVLSDVVGCVSLRACAETVRWNWPKARILILGRAPYEFEDHLYDDSLVHASDGRALVATLDRLAEDPWRQRLDVRHSYLAERKQPVVARRQPIEALQLKIREPASSSYLCSQSIQ